MRQKVQQGLLGGDAVKGCWVVRAPHGPRRPRGQAPRRPGARSGQAPRRTRRPQGTGVYNGPVPGPGAVSSVPHVEVPFKLGCKRHARPLEGTPASRLILAPDHAH
eukprot:366311-Chlamydomonas_euryale.AAC.7